MKFTRITIAGLMAAVAVIDFDCFIFAMMHGAGVMLIGLALTVGIVCWWRRQGQGNSFWLGFEVAGLAAVLIYIGTTDVRDLIIGWPRYLLVCVPMNPRYVMDLLSSL